MTELVEELLEFLDLCLVVRRERDKWHMKHVGWNHVSWQFGLTGQSCLLTKKSRLGTVKQV